MNTITVDTVIGRSLALDLERDPDSDLISLSLADQPIYWRAAKAVPGSEGETIDDLEGGMATVRAFVDAWLYATEDQREDMLCGDLDNGVLRKIRRRSAWRLPALLSERHIPSTVQADGHRITSKALLAALKGVSRAKTVWFSFVVIRSEFLRLIAQTHETLIVDYDPGPWLCGALKIRSGDGRASYTIYHGAGDPCAGRNGFTARLALVPQA